MSTSMMYLIGSLYFLAAFGYANDGKFAWAGVTFCWGISNFLLGYLSNAPQA